MFKFESVQFTPPRADGGVAPVEEKLVARQAANDAIDLLTDLLIRATPNEEHKKDLRFMRAVKALMDASHDVLEAIVPNGQVVDPARRDAAHKAVNAALAVLAPFTIAPTEQPNNDIKK